MNARDEAKRLRAATVKALPRFLVLTLDAQGSDGIVFSRIGRELDDLEYRARYAPNSITREDIMAFASVANSYRALIEKPAAVRNILCARLQEHDDGERSYQPNKGTAPSASPTKTCPACLGRGVRLYAREVEDGCDECEATGRVGVEALP